MVSTLSMCIPNFLDVSWLHPALKAHQPVVAMAWVNALQTSRNDTALSTCEPQYPMRIS